MRAPTSAHQIVVTQIRSCFGRPTQMVSACSRPCSDYILLAQSRVFMNHVQKEYCDVYYGPVHLARLKYGSPEVKILKNYLLWFHICFHGLARLLVRMYMNETRHHILPF